MPKLIFGKCKFNQEKPVDTDPYSSIESMKKKVKAVNGHMVEHATFDFEKSNRHESWNLLRRLRNTNLEPWCVCGYFNEIMYANEKKGGAIRDERQMEEFRKSKASQRQRVNKIRGLEDSDGVLKSERMDMEIIIKDYFMGLFKSNGVGNTNHILSGVHRRVTEDMNQILVAEYNEIEIVEALNSIGPTKASGPDGFPAIFFQKF
ncbi:hypothetical protein PVK06_036285 [Gossypium arboreum]|uniref:Reverse transcriptase n=1 Tax=Gossypium arboreum TaxID=29729 RepID=A0ABR0NLJ7_GOSAR|nr:hypothetical protein PVK06_036285 [Gossypium arboreum]